MTLYFDGNPESFRIQDFAVGLALLLNPQADLNEIRAMGSLLFDLTLTEMDVQLGSNPLARFDLNGDGAPGRIEDFGVALGALLGAETLEAAELICLEVLRLSCEISPGTVLPGLTGAGFPVLNSVVTLPQPLQTDNSAGVSQAGDIRILVAVPEGSTADDLPDEIEVGGALYRKEMSGAGLARQTGGTVVYVAVNVTQVFVGPITQIVFINISIVVNITIETTAQSPAGQGVIAGLDGIPSEVTRPTPMPTPAPTPTPIPDPGNTNVGVFDDELTLIGVEQIRVTPAFPSDTSATLTMGGQTFVFPGVNLGGDSFILTLDLLFSSSDNFDTLVIPAGTSITFTGDIPEGAEIVVEQIGGGQSITTVSPVFSGSQLSSSISPIEQESEERVALYFDGDPTSFRLADLAVIVTLLLAPSATVNEIQQVGSSIFGLALFSSDILGANANPLAISDLNGDGIAARIEDFGVALAVLLGGSSSEVIEAICQALLNLSCNLSSETVLPGSPAATPFPANL